MGSIIEKLDYLAEIKEQLKQALIEMGVEITDEMKFREYVEQISGLSSTNYITQYIQAKMNDTTTGLVRKTAKSEYVPDHTSMICPKIRYEAIEGYNSVYNSTIPFSARGGHGNYNAVVSKGKIDFFDVEATEGKFALKIALNMVKPYVLILPPCVNLVQYTLTNGTTGTDSTSFLYGYLEFGQSVYDSVSSWINRTISGARNVYFPDDFKMTAGKTLYLNKIPINHECVNNMVKCLYNYTDGTTRTISLDSSTKNLIEKANIQEALDKGWKIS